MSLLPKHEGLSETVDSVLAENGFKETAPVIANNDQNIARVALNKHGATVENILGNLVHLMEHSEHDNVRIKAVETALGIQGVATKHEKAQSAPQIQIVFADNPKNGANRLDSIFCPQRD